MKKDSSKKPSPIDIDSIDLQKLKEKTADLPALLEYAHSVGGFAITPTKEGEIKGKAREVMAQQTQMQLEQIFEQMQLLAEQAKRLKERAQLSELIYQAKISFTPVVGQSYYLYKKNDGTNFLSLVAPDEWGKTVKKHSFVSKVTLLADHTWKTHD